MTELAINKNQQLPTGNSIRFQSERYQTGVIHPSLLIASFGQRTLTAPNSGKMMSSSLLILAQGAKMAIMGPDCWHGGKNRPDPLGLISPKVIIRRAASVLHKIRVLLNTTPACRLSWCVTCRITAPNSDAETEFGLTE